MLSHDGSGKGAALVAAVANRLFEESRLEENESKNRVLEKDE